MIGIGINLWMRLWGPGGVSPGVDSLLQENGFAILLEDGGFLLLET